MDRAVDEPRHGRRLRLLDSPAAVGPVPVERLPGFLEGLSAQAARTTVRTAALTGGEEALERLAGYAADVREEVRQELADAWGYFDPDEYARRVLPLLPFKEVYLPLAHPAQ